MSTLGRGVAVPHAAASRRRFNIQIRAEVYARAQLQPRLARQEPRGLRRWDIAPPGVVLIAGACEQAVVARDEESHHDHPHDHSKDDKDVGGAPSPLDTAQLEVEHVSLLLLGGHAQEQKLAIRPFRRCPHDCGEHASAVQLIGEPLALAAKWHVHGGAKGHAEEGWGAGGKPRKNVRGDRAELGDSKAEEAGRKAAVDDDNARGEDDGIARRD
mmetsp:Transcript_59431/g.118090  ORF Transcript_59431/g.118090 Transcript_59431/m.118090 type:complete len:214 (+) Transcript_59431:565-1206(+)|eukprot:CAMPEP_0174699290 /NCGR_PEP_ID=MMETSP1094-20130205/4614_1 /TAXON_ID=156173 /ORGANISM="Chrysochromulina brevifilum, Strain UTEX LB 985" /LENGTH=213 /DNA_ID=CAMNT_0015896593 /DNA_START=561 /DNA_END=1202 /DNA_ORIENTATION=+